MFIEAFCLLPYVNIAYIRVQVDLVYKSTPDRLYVSLFPS